MTESQRAYRQSPRGKAAIARYWASPKGQALKKKNNAKYFKKHRKQIDKVRLEQRTFLKQVAAQAKDRPCMDCHQEYPPYVMDFDHVRGVKHKKISSMMGSTIAVDTLLAEIAKCDVVCANCHRIRHGEQYKVVLD